MARKHEPDEVNRELCDRRWPERRSASPSMAT
jgi:hypothetical protein